MTDAVPQEGEAQCLVSEFPNPPPYYKLFGSLPAHRLPPPPPIPTAKLEATAQKVAEITTAVQKIRDEQQDTLVGVDPSSAVAAAAHGTIAEASAPPDLEEVISIFGEVVEDPLLRIANEKETCDNPRDIASEMKKVNKEIMTSFVTLTNVLLQEPEAAREELVKVSKLLVRLLEESNRYREHQARENLIAVLEEKVEAKRKALAEVERDLETTEAALEEVAKLRDAS
mmetsp:Transcript_9758/g.27324  ORF Transcript_9758/g.27324 Transcript_9758/m.27324 type:complete len:228 (-) Transcript_9758:375-1058(-)